MASSDSQIDKPQRGHPKRAELPDVNINTGAQSINTEIALKLCTALPWHLPGCVSSFSFDEIQSDCVSMFHSNSEFYSIVINKRIL